MGSVFDFLWKLFGEQYYLCYVESKVALFVLSLPTLYLILAIAEPALAGAKTWREKLEKWRQKSIAGGRFKGIRNFLRYWTAKFCLNRATFAVACLALLLGWHWLFSSYGEELYLRFDKDKFGILVTRFTGADLTGRFGPLGLREKVAASVSFHSDPRLRHDYEIRFSNKEFRNEESAKDYAKSTGAQMAIWGYGEQSQNSLAVTIGFTLPRWLEFRASHASGAFCRIEPESQKTLTDEKGSDWLANAIAEWVDFVAVYSLIVASVHGNDYDAALRYVRLAAEVRKNPDASDLILRNFLMCYCATAKEDWGDVVVAGQDIDSLVSRIPDFPNPLRSSIRFGTGAAYLMLSDTARAITELREAVRYDSTNDNATGRLAQVLIKRAITGLSRAGCYTVLSAKRDYLETRRMVDLTLQIRPRDSTMLKIRDALNTAQIH